MRTAQHCPLQMNQLSPLRGRRIAVTRPREQSAGFVDLLESAGAEVLRTPLIQIVPAADPEPLREAARQIGGFDWIIFTSANGVESFWDAVAQQGVETAFLRAAICAIGPSTAEAITARGGIPRRTAAVHTAEGIVDALEDVDLAGKRILLPQADGARESLAPSLRGRGANVVQIEAYRTVADRTSVPSLEDALNQGRVDMVTFTSGSAVRSFVENVGPPPASIAFASIGPITSAVARELGLQVEVEAKVYSVEGLTEAILLYYSGRGQ